MYIVSGLSLPTFLILLWVPLCIAIIGLHIPCKITVHHTNPSRISSQHLYLIAVYLFCIGSFFTTIVLNRTTDSLLGPWDHISALPFILYYIGSLALFTVLLHLHNTIVGVYLLSVHFFASFSVALLRFPLGFGFDPLLHNAAEKLVLAHGTVTPKTFYYIGQYVLVPFLSRLLDLPVETFHQSLLPILLASSVPVFLYCASRKVFGWSTPISLMLALLFLTLPYPHLIMTTPWGLAYGTTVLTILSSSIALSCKDARYGFAALCLGLATCFLHPLAGIPLCLFLIIVIIFASKLTPLLKILTIVPIFILSSISIPIAFLINAKISSQLHVTLNMRPWNNLTQSIHLQSLQTRFLPLLDFSYFFLTHGGWIFLILICAGSILLKKKNQLILLSIWILGAGMFALNGLLVTSFLHFDTLAAFEQRDYGDRMFQLATLFCIPLAGYTLGLLLTTLMQTKSTIVTMTTPLLLASVLTSSLYMSYPRNDAYAPSHGYTLSATDISTVRVIAEHAGSAPYIVIANQVVASAAIKEFGFAHYYKTKQGAHETLFYYPIPTGSPFFQTYLSMLRAPSHTTMNDAMNLVCVSRSYFVVRDYEPRFPIIVRDAKKTSDEWHAIDGGKAFIFLYRK